MKVRESRRGKPTPGKWNDLKCLANGLTLIQSNNAIIRGGYGMRNRFYRTADLKDAKAPLDE